MLNINSNKFLQHSLLVVFVFAHGNSWAMTEKSQSVCENGQGSTKSGWEVESYKKDANQGNADAQYSMGWLYSYGQYGLAKDDRKAVGWYQKAANQGYAPAQNNLGLAYQWGYGIEKKIEEAVRLYQLAAEQNAPYAQCNLGYCSEHGYGIEQNLDKAIQLNILAANQGYIEAQFNLGVYYRFGRGIESDEVEAIRMFDLAAKQKHVLAQNLLSPTSEITNEEKEFKDTAICLYYLAFYERNAEAANSLGDMYHNGVGVSKNLEEAKRWYELAADSCAVV